MRRQTSRPRARLAGRACLLLGLLLSALLLSCAEPTPTPEPVTIRFAHHDYEEEYYEGLAAEFRVQYPHVTVELLPSTWQELAELSPDDADVFVNNRGLRWVLDEQGEVLGLDPWIEQDESFDPSDFYPGVLGLYSRDGKIWSVPLGLNLFVMYYNKDLFDQYEVPYPEPGWTWGDFLERAVAIRDPEAEVFGYASYLPAVDVMACIYQHGGRYLDDWQNPTRFSFYEPLAMEAVEWYAGLIHDYDVAPTARQALLAFGTRRGNVYWGLRQGKVGMWSGYYSERGGLSWPVGTQWTFSWGILPLPRDQRGATFMGQEMALIFSDALHPDTCWDWVSYVSRQVPYALAPARESIAESEAYEEAVGAEVAAAVRESLRHRLSYAREGTERGWEAWSAFSNAVQEIVKVEASPREALERAARATEP